MSKRKSNPPEEKSTPRKKKSLLENKILGQYVEESLPSIFANAAKRAELFYSNTFRPTDSRHPAALTLSKETPHCGAFTLSKETPRVAVTKYLNMIENLEKNENKLEIKTSSLVSELKIKTPFDGVFVREGQLIEKGRDVCRYYVSIHSSKDKHNNMYDIQFGKDDILDGSIYVAEIRDKWANKKIELKDKPTWNFGPFLNDTYGTEKAVNCTIGGTLYWDPKLLSHHLVLRSTKQIKANEELFWSYGKSYWVNPYINKTESS